MADEKKFRFIDYRKVSETLSNLDANGFGVNPKLPDTLQLPAADEPLSDDQKQAFIKFLEYSSVMEDIVGSGVDAFNPANLEYFTLASKLMQEYLDALRVLDEVTIARFYRGDFKNDPELEVWPELSDE